jgi:xylan 1,4-beta-xylosidase
MDEAEGIQIFLASHHDDWDVTTPSRVTVTLDGAELGRRYHVHQMLVSRDSSNAHTVWQDMGRPQQPDSEQLTEMSNAARLTQEWVAEITATADAVRAEIVLPSHSACLLSFVPVDS